MELSSSGEMSTDVNAKASIPVLLLVVVLGLTSAVGASVGGFFAMIASNRQADVDAARLALDLLEVAPTGDAGAAQRDFALRLLEANSGVQLDEDAYAAWLSGDSVVVQSFISRELAETGTLRLPNDLAAPCELPTQLEQGNLTQADAATYWGRDRRALSTCSDKHASLVRLLTGSSSNP